MSTAIGKWLLMITVWGSIVPLSSAAGFEWKDTPGKYIDLHRDGKKVLRYMCAFDASTPQKQVETFKVFYHVFDETGEKFLTNGPDGDHPYPAVTYPHHRGIFVGWNKTGFQGKTVDTWHMKGAVQKHIRVLDRKTASDRASLKTLIHWLTDSGNVIVEEQREVIVYASAQDIFKADFVCELKAVEGDINLDGDPEHAGFQYRPHNDVAIAPVESRAKYLFPTETADPTKDQNIPWVGLEYPLNGKTYHVLHCTSPANPQPYVYSAYRDYGRFGSFFKTSISKGRTLKLDYRIRVCPGNLPSRDQLNRDYLAFVTERNLDKSEKNP
ncbi:MAG: hypothetical protein GX455_00410 [Phycisphaerae bacterium]|nr:hypothetical protein [Phycisphaerae bacterium]